ncbi:LCP family protein [Oscillospiraceae bacterium MB08-C2-2]|nr:LCP family protein [Oscillospiraceae bacterium MB08-C2-2]
MEAYKKFKYRCFFLSFSGAFLALTVLILWMVTTLRPTIKKTVAATPQDAVYTPVQKDALTLLVMGLEAADSVPGSYVLLRLDPVAGSIPVVVLPPKTLVSNGGKEETLAEVYTYGGADYTRIALAETLGITIDRYARINQANFIKAAKTVGNVEFSLPAETTITGSGGMEIILQKGLQLLDGAKVVGLITHKDYIENQPARCKITGDLAVAIINQRLDVALSTVVDPVFEAIINLIDSDITYPDYEQRKAAAAYMAKLETPPAYYLPLGASQKGEDYQLTDTFVARIGQVFS